MASSQCDTMPGLTYLRKQTIYSENKQTKIVFFTECRFHEQAEFTIAFECLSTEEINKCLSKFYVSARKKDGKYYKKQTVINLK